MIVEKRNTGNKAFDIKDSISRAKKEKAHNYTWEIYTSEGKITWKNGIERVEVLRKGLPYETIEVVGQKANLPVKQMLQFLDVAQTTYNKKKRDKELLNGRDSEVLLILTEVLDFGLEVFNHEKDKFQRWMKKTNMSLGNVAPISFFDSISGIQEVRNALNRLEYGNMA